MYWYEKEFKVRYTEIDRMDIVHNSKYFIYQEEARLDFLDKVVAELFFAEEKGYLMPVVRNTMNYIKPAKYGEKIFARVAILKITNVLIEYISAIFNEENELLAYGSVSNCITDESLKPIAIKKFSEDVFLDLKKMETKDFFKKSPSRQEICDFFTNIDYKI